HQRGRCLLAVAALLLERLHGAAHLLELAPQPAALECQRERVAQRLEQGAGGAAERARRRERHQHEPDRDAPRDERHGGERQVRRRSPTSTLPGMPLPWALSSPAMSMSCARWETAWRLVLTIAIVTLMSGKRSIA